MDAAPRPLDQSSPARGWASRALALLSPPGLPHRQRAVLGIAGSPGAGKTTFAQELAFGVNELAGAGTAVVVPMDGFHLANATLDSLALRGRKGAIETFDAWGFLALVSRIAAAPAHTIYAPAFDRAVDEGVAGSIAIPPSAQLVIIEGNYLLVTEQPWASLAALFTETWFVETPPELRLRRLVERHTLHGKSPVDALAWATEIDGANAKLIEATAARATRRVLGDQQ
jgi:pantothenate kinase